MDFEIHEPDAIGKTKTVCGNCQLNSFKLERRKKERNFRT
jgi:hypothetical protein